MAVQKKCDITLPLQFQIFYKSLSQRSGCNNPNNIVYLAQYIQSIILIGNQYEEYRWEILSSLSHNKFETWYVLYTQGIFDPGFVKHNAMNLWVMPSLRKRHQHYEYKIGYESEYWVMVIGVQTHVKTH